MEGYKDMESDVLIAYNASDETDAIQITATTEEQKQEKMCKRLQITGVPDLQNKISKLKNIGVLKATKANAAKWKSKTGTSHSVKKSTSLNMLKMIARQEANKKSQLEEWKTKLLHNLTNEIAKIHNMHNNVIKAQRDEIER